jgi:sulfopyruvate decarboxylase beta subunit
MFSQKTMLGEYSMSFEASKEIIKTLQEASVNFFATLPCEKVKRLYNMITKHFRHVSLSREEEGVGICAGAYLAGAKPAMLIQSSGIGNMINALCSLTKTYEMPILILASWRGVYKEQIPAQITLGKKLPKILSAMGISYSNIKDRGDIPSIKETAIKTYENNATHAVLLNPMIWNKQINIANNEADAKEERRRTCSITHEKIRSLKPVLTRFEILKTVASYLEGKIVVCNLGIPCKELYSIKHQKSNFYMLGSMGLASSIGLGISLFTSKDVVVIDGDGSLLANLGTLSTIALAKPRNLTILAVDNGAHGTTGNQPTATKFCVDLELTARGLGLKKTYKAASQEEIFSMLQSLDDGPNFVHILAKPGNSNVPNVPLSPLEIKRNVIEALKNEA